MAEPTSKVTRSKRGMRRSHTGLKPASPSSCPNCGAIARPHRACSECGYYKDREVIRPKSI